ncbi:MAG: CHAT domain-containing protein [Hormoscilla sp.]
MARKRRLFFHRIQSLNRILSPRRRSRIFIILALVGLIASISISMFQPAVARQTNYRVSQNAEPEEKSRNAGEFYSEGKYDRAIELWKEAAQIYREREDRYEEMESLINIATAQYFLGNYPQSCNGLLQAFGGEQFEHLDCKVLTENTITLQGELDGIKSEEDEDSTVGLREKLEALTAEQIEGLTPESQKFQEELNLLIKTVKAEPDSLNKATGLRRFGDVLRQLGNYQVSHKVLTESLDVARRLNSVQEESATLISLGNVEQDWGKSFQELQDLKKAARDLKLLQKAGKLEEAPLGKALAHLKEAKKYYQQASQRSESDTTRVQAEINYLSLLIYSNQIFQADISQKVTDLERQIKGMLVNLPVSRAAIYARINLVETLTESRDPIASDVQLLKDAVKEARQLQDRQAEAYALGSLGKFYEAAGQLAEAQKLTAAALKLISPFEKPEVAYLWHWQQGRIFKQEGQTKLATDYYRQAYNDLQTLRKDLASINPNVQFSFRDTIEPVYRNYVSLLLRSDDPSQEDLKKAQEVIDFLQIAELENFFGDPCLQVKAPVDINEVIDKEGSEAAVIYPIVLADHLEIILTLPGQNLARHRVEVSREELERTIDELLRLVLDRNTTDIFSPAEQLYDWLIRPIDADLKQSGVQTLVFVLDGELRRIPMPLLYDRKTNQYLLEQDYNIALTSSLQLLDAPQKLRNIKVLAAGISEEKKVEGKSFTALPYVKVELEENIKPIVSSEVLLDDEFTKDRFQALLSASNYNIVHLATHGEFSSDLKETFILIWDELIDINELNSFLQQQNPDGSGKIELLVLSACQTAEGDDRAVLGLAGVAVRGGAGSTLGTLWKANDKATAELMGEFYRNLTAEGTEVSKALREAQLALLKKEEYQHPYYWAPFVLVGNWL